MFYVALLGVMFCLFCLFMFEFFSMTVYLSRPNDVLVKVLRIYSIENAPMMGKSQWRPQGTYRFENDE